MAISVQVQGVDRAAGSRQNEQAATRSGRKTAALLWTVQGLLAGMFVMTGLMKLATPFDVLAAQMPLPFPEWFVRFLGLAEFLGAFGLVLPSLLRIRPSLTPLAGSGLVIIMTGATAITLVVGGGPAALIPLVIGLLAAFVAYGRRRLAPQTSR